jgi:hypothetical protein
MIKAGFGIILKKPELEHLQSDPNGSQLTLLTITEINLIMKKDNAANVAAAGMVRTHAHTILPATRHLTADSLVVDPTPAIAPVIVCVVETGIPNIVAPNNVIAPAVSAQNPPTGLSFVIFEPIV